MSTHNIFFVEKLENYSSDTHSYLSIFFFTKTKNKNKQRSICLPPCFQVFSIFYEKLQRIVFSVCMCDVYPRSADIQLKDVCTSTHNDFGLNQNFYW